MWMNLESRSRSLSSLLSITTCFKASFAVLKLINYSYGYKPIGVPHFGQVHLSNNIVMRRPTGYSLRASDSLTVPRFSSIYGKNSIAHRGPALWNILISKDKHFSNTSYKNLKMKIRSMDNFTTTTTTTFIYTILVEEKKGGKETKYSKQNNGRVDFQRDLHNNHKF